MPLANLRSLPALLGALALAACTVDQPAPPPPAADPAVEPPSTEANTPAPATGPAARPEPLKLDPGTTKVQDLSAAIQRLGELMTVMRAAITEAGESTEGDHCAKARATFLASNDALRKALEEEPLPGGRNPPFWQLPEPARFTELCHSLPPEVQRCARLDLRAEDRATCVPLIRGLEGETKAAFEQMAASRPDAPE